MIPAGTLFRTGQRSVVERGNAAVEAEQLDDRVARYERRRGRSRRGETGGAIVPSTVGEALCRVTSLVLANHALLDAAATGTTDELDAEAERIEQQLADTSPAAALDQFADVSLPLLERCEAEPDRPVGHVYPMARTAADIAAFVAVELHLVARMIDPTYVPDEARELMRLYNSSLRPVLGHGLESWAAERVKPWRGLVIRRGLAWP